MLLTPLLCQQLPTIPQRLLLRSTYVLLCTIVACVVVSGLAGCQTCLARNRGGAAFKPGGPPTECDIQPHCPLLQPFFNAIVGLVGAITYFPRERYLIGGVVLKGLPP